MAVCTRLMALPAAGFEVISGEFQATVRVIQRFFHLITRGFLALAIATLVLTPCIVQAADGIEISQAHLEHTDEGYKLSANYDFELNHGLQDAITHGIPLYFTTEISLTRPRWYWFDEKAVSAAQTTRISYNVLTRQYHAAILGSLQQTFNSLQEVISLIRRPNRWLVAERGALKSGATYNVAIRMRLDVAQLSKPFQVNALNNSDWRLSSDWKNFSYKAD